MRGAQALSLGLSFVPITVQVPGMQEWADHIQAAVLGQEWVRDLLGYTWTLYLLSQAWVLYLGAGLSVLLSLRWLVGGKRLR